MACILLCSSAVRVHDSQAHRKMDVTRKHINRILELNGMLLSFQTGFNLDNAVVVCATLKSISGLEPVLVLLSHRTIGSTLAAVVKACWQYSYSDCKGPLPVLLLSCTGLLPIVLLLS